MKTLIRADASSAIGIGHLMRSLALAEGLLDGQDEVTLVTSEKSGPLVGRWREIGANVVTSKVPSGSLRDAELTKRTALAMAATWVVVDGYTFDGQYRSAVRDAARLMVIDDHGLSGDDAELILNGNLYASKASYPEARGRVLAGPRYALLRREFRVVSGPVSRQGVVVSLGGADPRSHTVPILQAMALRGLKGCVVIGPRNDAASSIERSASRLGWDVVVSPRDMAQVLRSCAIAVVGSGTTVLEALALGTPLVAVVLAVNQAPVADALARLAVATVVDGRDPGGVAEAVTDLLADPERGRAMARRGRGFVDGRGALRAAAAMREPMLVVRPASLRDVDVLLEWRNDPVTRAASFQSEPVGRAEHSEWLERALASDDTVVSVGELAGRPMGTVRLDLRASGATISLTIAPWARDRGLARPLIRKALRQAATLGISRVYAHIRPQNHASQQAFASAGFEWTDDVEPAVPGALVMVANPSRKGGSVDED